MSPPQVLPTRKLGKDGPEIPAIGFGLMGMSIGYGKVGTDEERLAVLTRAWELGYTNWDTADGYGDSEDLVGKWFARYPSRRKDIFLATKFALGFGLGDDGQPRVTVDSTPEYCRQAADRSLARLGTEYIDLLYMHRTDGKTPIERTVAAMKQLQEDGKVRHLGLSSVSAATLRRACAVCPIAAVQVEYSPWSVEIEQALLPACRELGVAVVAYSPLGRGMLTGRYRSLDDFEPDDLRRTYGRYSAENFPKNLAVVDKFHELASKKGYTASQMALAWLLKQGADVIPIPGTRSVKYVEENVAALKVDMSDEEEKEIRGLVDQVVGSRSSALLAVLDELTDTPEL